MEVVDGDFVEPEVPEFGDDVTRDELACIVTDNMEEEDAILSKNQPPQIGYVACTCRNFMRSRCTYR